MPCINHAFLRKLHDAQTYEQKRALVTERLQERRMRQKDKAAVVAARESYTTMYKKYCNDGPADPAICAKWATGTGSTGSTGSKAR